MGAITQYSKIVIKRSTTTGEQPTIGTTTDHTDGTWSATDIYVGEYFYNVADNRLWIGKLGGVQEISTAQLFELTYAEAELAKTTFGSPSGTGLIIGALYKITDRGENGLILQAIDVDKFSNYCNELIASPEEHIPAIYEFDNDVLTYPSGANYNSYVALLNQTGTNAPVATTLNDAIGGGVWSRIPTILGVFGNYDYKFTPTTPFDATKTFVNEVSNSLTGVAYGTYIDDFNQNDGCVYIREVPDSTLHNAPIEIRVYN